MSTNSAIMQPLQAAASIQPRLLRYAMSLSIGVVVTFSLLLLMQHLIMTGEIVLDPEPRYRLLPFVRVAPTEEIPPTIDEPAEQPDPEIPPDPPEIIIDYVNGGNPIPVTVSPPPIDTPIVDRGMRGYGQGDLTPIFKVLPIYPLRPLRLGLEGYVIVEFTVTRTGSVADVQVVESTHGDFEKPAVAAAYKFKYSPRHIDGVAVDAPGVRNKITFVLEN